MAWRNRSREEGNVVQRLKRIITCRESKEKYARQATTFAEGRSKGDRERRTEERTGEREREREREKDRIRGVDRYGFAHRQLRKSVNVSEDREKRNLPGKVINLQRQKHVNANDLMVQSVNLSSLCVRRKTVDRVVINQVIRRARERKRRIDISLAVYVDVDD